MQLRVAESAFSLSPPPFPHRCWLYVTSHISVYISIGYNRHVLEGRLLHPLRLELSLDPHWNKTRRVTMAEPTHQVLCPLDGCWAGRSETRRITHSWSKRSLANGTRK